MIKVEDYKETWSYLEFLKWIRSEFDAIPEGKWCTGAYHDKEGRCCAAGHCGVVRGIRSVNVTERLDKLFKTVFFLGVININDGDTGEVPGNTPKQRIINAIDICIKSYETKSEA